MDDIHPVKEEKYEQNFMEHLKSINYDIMWTTEGDIELTMTPGALADIEAQIQRAFWIPYQSLMMMYLSRLTCSRRLQSYRSVPNFP